MHFKIYVMCISEDKIWTVYIQMLIQESKNEMKSRSQN